MTVREALVFLQAATFLGLGAMLFVEHHPRLAVSQFCLFVVTVMVYA